MRLKARSTVLFPQPEGPMMAKVLGQLGAAQQLHRDQELVELEESKAWRAKRYDAGFGWITGPEEFPFQIRPAVWQTGWAYAFGLLAAVVAVSSVHRWRLRAGG